MTFLTDGRHRVQNLLFSEQIGSVDPSGIGLRSGSRLRRMRPYLELPEARIEIFGKSWSNRAPTL